MQIPLNSYAVFVAVARHNSFSKAARELFVSQSSVSQTIKNLEHKLGFTLFVRNTQQIYLTEKGQKLYHELSNAFQIIHNVEKEVCDDDSPLKGTVHIAATDTLCKHYLLPKIKKLHDAYPKIKFKIINGTSPECQQWLETGRVDFAIMNIPPSFFTTSIYQSKFRIEKQASFQDRFVASRDYPIPNSISLCDIAKNHLLILDENSYTRKFLNKLFKKNDLRIVPEIELQNIDILLEMTKIGLGISFIPDLCIQNEMDIRCLKIVEEIPLRYYGILSLQQTMLSAVANTFLQFMK